MTKNHDYQVQTHLDDCDPAGIASFANFARWMDQSSLALFRACDVPPCRALLEERGIVGTPLLEIGTRFLCSVTCGDVLIVRTCIEHWAPKTIRHRHLVYRGVDLACDGFEACAFVARESQTDRLTAIPIPPNILGLCR